MLIKCQECGLQVSDKALSCPHCGISLVTGRKITKNRSRRRLPNGFGRITKLNNQNLRSPYRVTITVGKDQYGRPIGKLLKPQAYFKTYNDAYEALIEYHRNPCSLDSGMTVEELYEKWSEEHFKRISQSSSRALVSAWRYCVPVYKMRVVDIRGRHIRSLMEDGTVEHNGEIRHATAETKSKIKSLWNLMLDYALEYEIVSQNYARAMNMKELRKDMQDSAKRSHISFTSEEMKTLWQNTDFPYVKAVLIQCYSGWRPNELVEIKLENISFDDWSIRGGSKTAAGIDRIVPIHSCIRSFVKDLYYAAITRRSEYLINNETSNGMSYYTYYDLFKNIIKALNLNPEHRPHDPRKQFVTMAKEADMNEYAIKRIVGHTITDLTENTYTDRSIEWLSSEIEKIKKPEM